jgi:hypothetical protein
MSTVLPSIIVLVMTALLVFRRDFIGRPAAPASKPARTLGGNFIIGRCFHLGSWTVQNLIG